MALWNHPATKVPLKRDDLRENFTENIHDSDGTFKAPRFQSAMQSKELLKKMHNFDGTLEPPCHQSATQTGR